MVHLDWTHHPRFNDSDHPGQSPHAPGEPPDRSGVGCQPNMESVPDPYTFPPYLQKIKKMLSGVSSLTIRARIKGIER